MLEFIFWILRKNHTHSLCIQVKKYFIEVNIEDHENIRDFQSTIQK